MSLASLSILGAATWKAKKNLSLSNEPHCVHGRRGTNSAGQSQYIYLPTANGPMPIAAVINGNTYAGHSDHLNTPRRLSNAEGQGGTYS